MAEFSVGGRRYRSLSLCAFDQWRLLERLRPILPALKGMDYSLRAEGAGPKSIASALAPLLKAPDEDVKGVFELVLAASERQDDGVWRPIIDTPPLVILMRITTQVVSENFSVLFSMERPSFRPVPIDRPVFEPVHMPGGKDWLLRPVLRRLCSMESLFDGTLRIEHLVDLNDALDVEDENAARAHAAARKK